MYSQVLVKLEQWATYSSTYSFPRKFVITIRDIWTKHVTCHGSHIFLRDKSVSKPTIRVIVKEFCVDDLLTGATYTRQISTIKEQRKWIFNIRICSGQRKNSDTDYIRNKESQNIWLTFSHVARRCRPWSRQPESRHP